jgi:hypothetical protein
MTLGFIKLFYIEILEIFNFGKKIQNTRKLVKFTISF